MISKSYAQLGTWDKRTILYSKTVQIKCSKMLVPIILLPSAFKNAKRSLSMKDSKNLKHSLDREAF